MKKVIGLSGVARAGKDTFAAILICKLQQAGKTVRRVAFADPLKSHVDEFLLKHLDITAFTPVPEQKTLIRPMLVWYGDAQRKRTNGRFWIDAAKKTIEETNYDYYIITDVRYATYEKDELYFLKNEMNGVLCHISKYKIQTIKDNAAHSMSIEKKFVQPANEHEALNDPRVKSVADYKVEWEHVDVVMENTEELLVNPTLNEHVDNFIKDMSIL